MGQTDAAVLTATDVDELLRALAETPRHLAALARGLDDDRLQRRPGADDWSANAILAHLRACADVWGGSIITMIEQDRPTLRYVSPRTYIRKTSYTTLPFQASLQAYTAQRTELIRVLAALVPADWSRGATFTGTMRGREQTIPSYARRIVDHEQAHRAQIEATLRSG
jgi:uncharacterized damage-inducible protein DinB